jgi:hypothetical protein
MRKLAIRPELSSNGDTIYRICPVNSKKSFACFVFKHQEKTLTFHQDIAAPKEAAKYAFRNAKTEEEKEQAMINIACTPIDKWVVPIDTDNGFPLMTNEYLNKVLESVGDLYFAKYQDCLLDYYLEKAKNVVTRANRAASNAKKAELKAMQAFCKSN